MLSDVFSATLKALGLAKLNSICNRVGSIYILIAKAACYIRGKDMTTESLFLFIVIYVNLNVLPMTPSNQIKL